jgi:hypothetical protein
METEKLKRILFIADLILAFTLAWLLAGTLDTVAAIFSLSSGNSSSIFGYVNGANYKGATFDSEANMIIRGIFIDYFIAACFTGFYFFIYRYIELFKRNSLLSIVIYGIFAWAIMNAVVLPLAKVDPGVFSFQNAILNMVMLMFTIGMPVTLARRWYERGKETFR